MLADEFYDICTVDSIRVTLRKADPLVAQATQPSLSIGTTEEDIYCLICAIVFEDVVGNMLKHMLR